MQEHESVDDAVKGKRRMERLPSVDPGPSPRPPTSDEAAVRQWQPPPPPPPLPPLLATGAPEAARPWTYLRPPPEQVVAMPCCQACTVSNCSTTEQPVSSS